MTDARNDIVNAAKWSVANKAGWHYSEGPDRMEGIGHPFKPCHSDCSAFVTLMYNWCGAADPNGLGYNGTGYTGTLLGHGQAISLSPVVPGDVIVYGPGTGEHTALIVEAGPDPLTVSMGQEGDPSYVRVSQDGRQPQRYLRFDTTKIGTAPAAPTTPTTSGADVILPTLSQGATGGYVKAVQALLKDKSGQNVAVDGAYGPGTTQAVKNVQAFFKVGADGVVGPQTWSILLGV